MYVVIFKAWNWDKCEVIFDEEKAKKDIENWMKFI